MRIACKARSRMRHPSEKCAAISSTEIGLQGWFSVSRRGEFCGEFDGWQPC
jgi:hypothetical protein